MRYFIALIAACWILSDSDCSCGESETTSLFNGKTLRGWVFADGSPVDRGWIVENGMLRFDKSQGRVGDIMTVSQFGDFELEFEWRIGVKGNSGIKYRTSWYGAPARIRTFEYQLMDDHNHPAVKDPLKATGCLYDLYPPTEVGLMKPLEEFNVSRIVARGDHIEHWLNGKKIVDAQLGTDDWKERLAKSKFGKHPGFGTNPRGPILIQDHGGDVWFKRIEVRELTDPNGKGNGVLADAGAARVNFDRDIRPILSNTCYTCHGPDANKRVSELRFDVEQSIYAEHLEPVIVPGKPDESALITRITSDDSDYRMPPEEQKQQLSKVQIELLKRWIAQGAEYTNHWAFETPQRPLFPSTDDETWPQNGIDWFVLNRLEHEKLKPSARAVKETLIRRATLDLTGLPPSPEEVDAFLSDETDDDFEKVVDRLLASDRFGEHFALSWLDAARYADSNGYQQDRTRTMWPWRDWVVRAFNSNMPFDRFTIEQIGGDLLSKPTTQQLVATGFQRNHMLNGEGGRIAEESRVEYVVNRVETMGATWLGLTVGCGRCHDHKYDPFSQKEFYQFYSYFNSIDERGNVDAGGNANPVLPVPTDEQRQRKLKLNSEVAKGQAELNAAKSAEKQRLWEQATLKQIEDSDVPEHWTWLTPEAAVSEQGQTMKIEDNAIVFVSGKNPAKDDYKVTLRTDLKSITGLRLETLPHESFTQGGLARSNSGNFVLTEFLVDAQSAGNDKPSRAKIKSAQADFEQNGWKVAGAFDGNGGTGWAVHNPSNPKLPRTAVFVFEKPIAGGEETSLTVQMQHQSPHVSHNIGRFRLSVTTAPDPKLNDSNALPQNLLAALKLDAGERNDAQKKLVSEEFRKRDPMVREIQQKIEAARKQISDLDKQVVRTMVMKELAKPRETFVLIRGNWNQPDKEQPIQPDTPECLPPLPENSPNNRLALAKWLVAPENPLTSRVIVNRFWQHFFGTGLVSTPEDFGSQGERPSHPQLLDWLATEFVASRWNVKHMLKLIVMSATYQQSSKVTPELYERDSANQLLARGARFRLTSQAIRDQALSLSGLLVEKQGGPPVLPYQPAGVWSDNSLGKIKYNRDKGEKLYRRTLYTYWRRATPPTMLFDVASRQVCKVRPSRTNTPLHALTLMNDITYIEASRKMAERVIRVGGDSADDRLAYGFRLATARHASDSQRATMIRVFSSVKAQYEQQPNEATKLLAIGDAPRDESIAPAELAAYATLMNVIMNLDEVLTKE